MVKRAPGLEKTVGQMDILTNTMKAQVGAPRRPVSRSLTPDRGPGAAPPRARRRTRDSPRSNSELKIDDILLEIQTVLAELRGGKSGRRGLRWRLKPWAARGAH